MLKKLIKSFWYLSGANIEILETLPTESSKYSGLGISVFFVAIIVGHVVFSEFNILIVSFFILLTMTIDRFLVSNIEIGVVSKKVVLFYISRILFSALIIINLKYITPQFSLFFIFISLLPIFLKSISNTGIYDEAFKLMEEESIQGTKILLKLSSDNSNDKLKIEKRTNEIILQEIADAQKEISRKAIEKWKNNEIEKLEKEINTVIIAK